MNFQTTPADANLIHRIADRAHAIWPNIPILQFEMDVTATHCNGCPLDLPKLLAADDFNFRHDIAGIYNHLDRDTTGQLSNHFLPRCAA